MVCFAMSLSREFLGNEESSLCPMVSKLVKIDSCNAYFMDHTLQC